MLQKISILLLAIIVVVSAVEFATHRTPLQQVQWAWQQEEADVAETTIRMGIASWQMGLFPWKQAIREYEEAHQGKIRIQITTMPEGSLNSMQAFWRFGETPYDVVVAWADEEIHPFINYNRDHEDPTQRGLIVDVTQYLTEEQLDAFVPALFVGSSRTDPETDEVYRYELPWMGEILALNYNRAYFQAVGIEKAPQTWAEVEDACRKLKGYVHDGRTVTPLAMNFSQSIFFAQNCYIPMLASFKAGRGIEDENGRLDVSSPEAIEVFKTLKRWYDAGYISSNCMVSAAVEQDLNVGRAAMFPHWQSRGLDAMQYHPDGAIAIAPTPNAREVGTLISTYGCIVPKCSPVVEEAIAFAYEAFCTDQYGFQTAVARGFTDPVTGKVSGGGKMPAIRSVYDDPDLPEAIASLGKSLQKGYFYPDLTNWNRCAMILAVEFQKYVTGRTSSAEKALRIVRERYASEVYGE